MRQKVGGIEAPKCHFNNLGAYVMDYEFDLIIQKECLSKMQLTEVLHEWGGVMYPSVPAEYFSSYGIDFYEVDDTDYFKRLMGKDISDSFIILHLKSDLIFELDYTINRNPDKLNENNLLSFIKDLSNLPSFYLLLVREDERISDVYEVNTREDIVQALMKCFDWDNPRDVMIYKNEIV